MGVRMVTKTKKWGKLKHGFGWIYSSKVKYSCTVESENPQTTNSDDIGSEGQSPGLASSNGGIILTRGLGDYGTMGESESLRTEGCSDGNEQDTGS